VILFLGVIVLAIGTGLVAGGRLRRFERLELRWWLLAPVGLALQAVPLPNARHGTDLVVRVAVLSLSYILLLIFAGANLRMAGVSLVMVGLASNMLVIAANGGMPVSGHALEASGQTDVLQLLLKDEGAKHHLMTPADHLTPLGDVIPIGSPVKQVVSVGDVFVYAGLAWLIVAVMRGRIREPDRPRESERYQGKHRPGSAARAAPVPPAGATRSGTSP
jgi:Family of unknown function (DUF5317)